MLLPDLRMVVLPVSRNGGREIRFVSHNAVSRDLDDVKAVFRIPTMTPIDLFFGSRRSLRIMRTKMSGKVRARQSSAFTDAAWPLPVLHCPSERVFPRPGAGEHSGACIVCKQWLLFLNPVSDRGGHIHAVRQLSVGRRYDLAMLRDN